MGCLARPAGWRQAEPIDLLRVVKVSSMILRVHEKTPHHRPYGTILGCLARPAGFEPTVFRVGVEHSIH